MFWLIFSQLKNKNIVHKIVLDEISPYKPHNGQLNNLHLPPNACIKTQTLFGYNIAIISL